MLVDTPKALKALCDFVNRQNVPARAWATVVITERDYPPTPSQPASIGEPPLLAK